MNRGITVLQTVALATWLCRHKKWSGRTDLNRRRLPWQGSTLPLSYARSFRVALNITNRTLLSIKKLKNNQIEKERISLAVFINLFIATR